MMPKGVERSTRRAWWATMRPVRIPMMPKGVERSLKVTSSMALNPVRIPMMPKGVERIDDRLECRGLRL